MWSDFQDSRRYAGLLLFCLVLLGGGLQLAQGAEQKQEVEPSAASLIDTDSEEDNKETNESEPLVEPPKNLFKKLPEDLYPVIASWLPDQELEGLICSCKAFDRVRSFFRQAEWGEFSSITYRYVITNLHAWAPGPTYMGRKTLYVYSVPMRRPEGGGGAPYLESAILQRNLTGLVLKVNWWGEFKKNLPLSFPKLTYLRLYIPQLNDALLATSGLAHCTSLETLDLWAGDNTVTNSDWLKGLTQLRVLKLTEYPLFALTSAYRLLQLKVLRLRFRTESGYITSNEEFASFLGQCGQLEEVMLCNLLVQSSAAAQVVVQQLGQLRKLATLQLLDIKIQQEHGTTAPDLAWMAGQPFKNLEYLSLLGWTLKPAAKGVFNLGNLPHLIASSFNSCDGLECLALQEGLPCLQELYCGSCSSLKQITGLSKCNKLKILRLYGCHDLERLHLGKHNLPSLVKLKCENCRNLKSFIGLARCKRLKTLQLTNCPSLKLLNLGVGGVPSLQNLACEDCAHLQGIAEVGRCHNLKTVRVVKCPALKWWNLGNHGSPSLQELECIDCPCLEGIAGLAHCPNLATLRLTRDDYVYCSLLRLKNHKGLVSLQMLKPKAPSLRALDCSGCHKLRDITALPACKNLRILNLHGCDTLDKHSEASLKIISQLPLEELDIGGWDSLDTIDQLVGLEPTIRRLECSSCRNLKDIRGLHKFKNLRALDLSACEALDDHPAETLMLLGQLPLEELEISSWYDLQSLSPLVGCAPTLRRLHCSDSPVEDIVILRQFHNLEFLNLGGYEGFLNLTPESYKVLKVLYHRQVTLSVNCDINLDQLMMTPDVQAALRERFEM